jgi:hypothetical protein
MNDIPAPVHRLVGRMRKGHLLRDCTIACRNIAMSYGGERRNFASDMDRYGLPYHPAVLRLFPRGSRWRRAVVKYLKCRYFKRPNVRDHRAGPATNGEHK